LDDWINVAHHEGRDQQRETRTTARRDVDGDTMNAIPTSTRQLTRTATARGSSVRATVRRLAAWWNDDTVSAHFSAARERDQRLLRRR
jgi:hypothetical protein